MTTLNNVYGFNRTYKYIYMKHNKFCTKGKHRETNTKRVINYCIALLFCARISSFQIFNVSLNELKCD